MASDSNGIIKLNLMKLRILKFATNRVQGVPPGNVGNEGISEVYMYISSEVYLHI